LARTPVRGDLPASGQMLASNADLARKLDALEKKYDGQFRVVFDAIRELMTPEPIPPKRQIGFKTDG
jgi:hypothetical protein